MKTLPLGISTFEKFINGNYLYIDKTEYLYKLVKVPDGVYFLSRPRRFGKSLTLSTLKSIFQGKKELFKGLDIYQKNYDWKEYPIIHIDFGDKKPDSAGKLEKYLCYAIDVIAEENKIELVTNEATLKFQELIRKLSPKGKIVILIDEYDKPILGTIENPEECKKILEILKSFYSVIKSADPYLRFVLLTGVSKFSKVSVFSDLNNLKDLTMNAEYAAMLGYTQEELEEYFSEPIETISKKEDISKEKTLDKIKKWYNGYRFSDEEISVYNPVSVMNLFDTGKFQNFWFETGTPTFLLNLLKKYDYNLQDIENLELSQIGFSSYEIDNLAIEPLLFQTGYITIKDYDSKRMLYTLGYPNFEVKNSFLQYLTGVFTSVRKEFADSFTYKLIDALEAVETDVFFKVLKSFFANIPYDLQLKNEKYYQTVFYVVFAMLGLKINAEEKTNSGRIDAVIETDNHIFIFEFKLFDTAVSALQQIKEKKYAEKYLQENKQIVLIGAAFDADTKNIETWEIEKI